MCLNRHGSPIQGSYSGKALRRYITILGGGYHQTVFLCVSISLYQMISLTVGPIWPSFTVKLFIGPGKFIEASRIIGNNLKINYIGLQSKFGIVLVQRQFTADKEIQIRNKKTVRLAQGFYPLSRINQMIKSSLIWKKMTISLNTSKFASSFKGFSQ